jgi:hypothetical protein
MTGAIITGALSVALVILAMVANHLRYRDMSFMLAVVGVVMAMVSCSRAGGVV